MERCSRCGIKADEPCTAFKVRGRRTVCQFYVQCARRVERQNGDIMKQDRTVITDADMDAEEMFEALQTVADELREIATDLRSGKRNQWHAANSIEKRANLIAKPRGAK